MAELADGYGLILFLILLIFLVFYIYCRYKLSYWRRRGVPQLDDCNLILGDYKDGLLMRTMPGEHLAQLYQRAEPHSRFVGFYIFHKPCLLIRDPELIKHIMIRDFNYFKDRHFGGFGQYDSTGMINLFGINEPVWSYLHKKLSPTFSLSKLKQMLPLMLSPCEPMMEYLRKHTVNNEGVVDAQDIYYMFTADLVANLAFGTPTNSFKHPDSSYIKSFMGFFRSWKRMVALVNLFFIPETANLIGKPLFFDHTFLRKMFWAAIERREQTGESRGDYIDSVLKLKNDEQNPLYKFDGDNLLHQAGTLLAFETSCYASVFTLMELAKNKECQELARRDVSRAVGRLGWSMEAFNAMKYVDRCLSEALRLHPPVSILDRYALKDYQIADSEVVIEKGTPVFVSLYGLQLDERFFEEPQVFKPERFDDIGAVSNAYLPYGIGPRKCLATKHGQLHVKIMLSKLLLEYEVSETESLQTGVPLDQRSPFTRAALGIPLHFKKIDQTSDHLCK